jgi:hypothetical protein
MRSLVALMAIAAGTAVAQAEVALWASPNAGGEMAGADSTLAACIMPDAPEYRSGISLWPYPDKPLHISHADPVQIASLTGNYGLAEGYLRTAGPNQRLVAVYW